MAATNLNIRTDKAIKEQAEQIFNELGLNMTTAITLRALVKSLYCTAMRMSFLLMLRCRWLSAEPPDGHGLPGDGWKGSRYGT